MITHLKLALEQAEYAALLKAAIADLRNPADQARFILRAELVKRGLLDAQEAPAIHPSKLAAQAVTNARG